MGKRIVITAFVIAVALLLPSRASARTLRVHLDWFPDAEFAGIFVGIEKGWYKEAGIEIDLKTTGRKKVLNTESQCIFPYERKLSYKAREAAICAIRTLVSHGKIKRGYFHVEFIFSNDQCRLIDANFGRLGGGPIGDILALSFRVEPTILYQHFLEISLYGESTFNPYEALKPLTSKSLLYGSPTEFFMKKLRLPSRMRSKHVQLRSDKSLVPPMGSNNWAWVGILTGISPTVDREFSQIRLVGNTGTTRPVC